MSVVLTEFEFIMASIVENAGWFTSAVLVVGDGSHCADAGWVDAELVVFVGSHGVETGWLSAVSVVFDGSHCADAGWLSAVSVVSHYSKKVIFTLKRGQYFMW